MCKMVGSSRDVSWGADVEMMVSVKTGVYITLKLLGVPTLATCFTLAICADVRKSLALHEYRQF